MSAIVLLVFVWTLDYTAVTLARLFGSEFHLAQNVVSLSFSADHIAQQRPLGLPADCAGDVALAG